MGQKIKAVIAEIKRNDTVAETRSPRKIAIIAYVCVAGVIGIVASMLIGYFR